DLRPSMPSLTLGEGARAPSHAAPAAWLPPRGLVHRSHPRFRGTFHILTNLAFLVSLCRMDSDSVRRNPSTTIEKEGSGDSQSHEVLAILTLAATLLLSMSLLSYDGHGGKDWVGPVGAHLASFLAEAFGLVAWV